jgi:hypothetical protein
MGYNMLTGSNSAHATSETGRQDNTTPAFIVPSVTTSLALRPIQSHPRYV